MEFSPNNNIVKRCMQGMGLEETGQPEEASRLFMQAWDQAADDFKKISCCSFCGSAAKEWPR